MAEGREDGFLDFIDWFSWEKKKKVIGVMRYFVLKNVEY